MWVNLLLEITAYLPRILFIALIALIFLGPQELPPVLRWIGKRVGQLQAFSRSFYEQLDQIQDPRIPGSFHAVVRLHEWKVFRLPGLI